MPATHREEDEVVIYNNEPSTTQEYYGICGVCNGSDEVPDIDAFRYRRGVTELCWNCGGDGKSVRITSP